MKIDHVSVGGRDLAKLESAFAEASMKAEYGGPHSSGLTKMSLLGFRDGSYIELISPTAPGVKPEIWAKQIEEDGGACAWAIEVPDIASEVSKAKSVGIPAEGPGDYSRKRPDGVSVEWKLGFIGEDEPGALLPFLITDTTPRSYRVKPSPSVSHPDSLLEGVTRVVLGVEELSAPSKVFMKLYGWNAPEEREDIWEGARLASFEGTPVVLASPTGDGWLKDRLRRFGRSPCAFLISTDDIAAATGKYPLGVARRWFGGAEMRWVEPLKDQGMLIGLLDG